MAARKNVDPGTQFSNLTFIAYNGNKGKNRAGLFRCVCGTEKTISVVDVKSGHTNSCGCLMPSLVSVGMKKHGHSNSCQESRAYTAWGNIKARCSNKNRDDFERYGGRGIRVCERWQNSFENFYADMGDPPDGHSIDRYPNNDGNYEPGNCRWATTHQQNSNQRSNINLTFNGKTQNLKAWSIELGLSYGTVKSRVRRGATDPEKILSNP